MKAAKVEMMAPKEDDSDEPQDHEIGSAMDTLLRAEEIKKNTKLMPHVEKKMGAQKQHVISSLKELKKIAKKKIAEEGH